MNEWTERLRALARELLATGQVDCVLGFEAGELPESRRPIFVRRPEDVERLIADTACGMNLATYLPKCTGRVAVVVKPCDARSVVVLLSEKQVERGRVLLIGLPCDGVQTANGLSEACRTCTHRDWPLVDYKLGEPIRAEPASKAAEELSADERWQHLLQQAERCLRCYACVGACPLCYCPRCFVEAEDPRWVGKTSDPGDAIMFFAGRALHLAGRCVECGACEHACPMGLDLAWLRRAVAEEIRSRFGVEAGLTVDEPPPLAHFRVADTEEFIR